MCTLPWALQRAVPMPDLPWDVLLPCSPKHGPRSANSPVRHWAVQSGYNAGVPLMMSRGGCVKAQVCADTGALLAGVG